MLKNISIGIAVFSVLFVSGCGKSSNKVTMEIVEIQNNVSTGLKGPVIQRKSVTIKEGESWKSVIHEFANELNSNQAFQISINYSYGNSSAGVGGHGQSVKYAITEANNSFEVIDSTGSLLKSFSTLKEARDFIAMISSKAITEQVSSIREQKKTAKAEWNN